MTTANRRRPGLLVAPVLMLALAGCGSVAPPDDPAVVAPAPTAATTPEARPSPSATTPPSNAPVSGSANRAEVDRLASLVAAEPDDPDVHRALGQALLQLVRETLDPSLYASAERALLEADRLRPDDARTLAVIGALQLGRHEFAAALETGRRAVRLSPGLSAAHAVVVDALVELGRYDEAEAAAGRMLAAGDDLGTLARLSYLRELHGDLEAARDLMARAADRPGLAPEHRAFALAILGNLDRWTGDPEAAQGDWESALALVPDHGPSLAGLARLAVGRSDLDAARDLFARAAAIVPLPEYVIALGEVQAALGDETSAEASFALASAEIQLQRSAGVVVDVDLALFEADHGDPRTALRLAESGWDATPTTRAADAVAWSLHRLGRDGEAATWSGRALDLGSRDPQLRYHAGAIAAALGADGDARRHLRAALDTDPGFSTAGAADAAALLASLGD